MITDEHKLNVKVCIYNAYYVSAQHGTKGYIYTHEQYTHLGLSIVSTDDSEWPEPMMGRYVSSPTSSLDLTGWAAAKKGGGRVRHIVKMV